MTETPLFVCERRAPVHPPDARHDAPCGGGVAVVEVVARQCG